jgi:hypothetical protein
VIGHGVWEEARDVATLLGWLGPIADRLRAGGGDAEAVSFQSPTPNEDLVKLAADWAATHVIATDPELIAELEEAGIPTERAETPAA